MSYKLVGPGQHIQKFIDSKCERIYMRVELQASIDIVSGRQIYLLFLFFSFQALNRFSRKIKHSQRMQILLYFMLKPGWLTDIKIQFLLFAQRLY